MLAIGMQLIDREMRKDRKMSPEKLVFSPPPRFKRRIASFALISSTKLDGDTGHREGPTLRTFILEQLFNLHQIRMLTAFLLMFFWFLIALADPAASPSPRSLPGP